MEFLAAACDHLQVANKENLIKAFGFFDKNGDGRIDIEEMKFALPTQDNKFGDEGSTVKDKMVNESMKQFN